MIACVARGGQQAVVADRLPDRIGIGVLAKVFPPELVDRVVDEAGAREQRKRVLPARVVVYLLLAMVLFSGSGYGQVWDRLVRGLEWARTFRVRVALGMQPSPAAISLARRRLGWQVMEKLLEAVAGPLAGEEQDTAYVAGMRLVAIDGMCLDVRRPGERGGVRLSGQRRCRGCSRRSASWAWASAGPGGAGRRAVAAVCRGAAAGLKLLARLSRGDLVLADRTSYPTGCSRPSPTRDCTCCGA